MRAPGAGRQFARGRRASRGAADLRILFVCLGNICRSPTAEGVLRKLAEHEATGLMSGIDSAGTADYHLGEPPDWRSVAAAARRGYDISRLRARQVCAADFTSFDLLLAMDRDNLARLARVAPTGGMDRVQLFLSYAPQGTVSEMPDPYLGVTADFERVIDLCELAARGLLRAQPR